MKTDIESALLEGRNFDIIDIFRANLYLLYSKKANIKKVNEVLLQSLKSLEKLVEDESIQYNAINRFDCNLLDGCVENIKITFDAIAEYILFFNDAYEFAVDALEIDKEHQKIKDLLM